MLAANDYEVAHQGKTEYSERTFILQIVGIEGSVSSEHRRAVKLHMV
jgi:hypothetical protein